MSKKYNDRILVTGAPRSGTSMLNLLMSYFRDLKVFEPMIKFTPISEQ